MSITFTTSLGHMTLKHYLEQPIPMFGRLIKKSCIKIMNL